MLSAMAQQAIVMEAVRAGACDFIVKPADPERVLAALHKALS
jgi:two-component system chemotaxis response regulator CheY